VIGVDVQTRSLVISLAAFAAACGALVVVLRPSHTGPPKQLVGSGHVITSPRAVGSFVGVELQGAAELNVVVGGRTAVSVRGDDNIVKIVDTTVRRGMLVISEHNRSFTTHVPLTVTVTTPVLDTATLAGAGTMRIERIRSARFTATFGGAGWLELAGRTRNLVLTLSGAGSADAVNLEAQSATVVVAGTGTARVTARRTLDATVSGTGTIIYGGGAPVVRTHISGTGTIGKV
jgi:Putative auto-transporter adhesin, head GIN domain